MKIKFFCFTIVLNFFINFNIYADTGNSCIIEKTNVKYTRNNYKLHLEKITAANCVGSVKFKYPDILLIHGVTFSSHQFDFPYKDYSLADFLAKHGFRVWLLDLTGYGNSQKPKNGFIVNSNYAANDIAGAVNLIRKYEHIEKINLLGWSFGTISSSIMAKKYTNWVNTLILYAPIFHAQGSRIIKDDYQKYTDEAALSDFQRDNQTKQIISTIAESGVIKQYLASTWQYDGNGSANGCRKDLFQLKNIALFDPKALTMPVLAIAGTNDPYVNWKNDIPYMSKVMPNKNNRIVKIEGASHILMLEKPYYHLFQKSILDFLENNN
ncbi:MAG: putative hydrolase [Burkholderiales bacterium]|jgi:pimeloyl-ACP methyl ester carboxylesterase|nr:putative hydrolase [Burkholderiales bacterium]